TFSPSAPISTTEPMGIAHIRKRPERNARRVAEEESPRAIRALRVSAAGKRAVLRNQDEAHLYRDICDALTREGGYPLAWIGAPVADARKSVQILASAGSGRGYLDGLEVSWGDGPLANGPAGTCIRTQAISIMNDTEHDPRMLPWRERAARFGFRSM